MLLEFGHRLEVRRALMALQFFVKQFSHSHRIDLDRTVRLQLIEYLRGLEEIISGEGVPMLLLDEHNDMLTIL